MFSALEPTVEECIQDELFAAFNCPQSKPVNTALQAIKKIIDHPAFRADEFISHLPLLFSSATKGIVSSSLTLADKLAKQTPAKRPEICQHLTGVFLSKDASLQNNAAKLLVKYGDPTDPALSALLMSYTDNLLFDARERLTDFLDVKPAAADIEEEVTKALPLIREDNRIPEIECWDDFVFLAGRAFLNLESYHFDQLPAALLRFAHEINEDNVAQLEPAFAQAWKMINPASSFDAMLASFYMEYAGVLLERFPLQTQKIQPLYEKYQAIKNSNKKYEKIDWGFYPFERELKKRCRPYIDLFIWVLSCLKNNLQVPLLSTPTHLPCFIDPAILVDRLYHYQLAGIEPCNQDLQLAIQRCVLTDGQYALDKLNGEYAALMRYFLHGELAELENIAHEDGKLTAIVTRNAIVPDIAAYGIGYALLEKKGAPVELLENILPWDIKKETTRYYSGGYVQKIIHFDSAKYSQQSDTTLFYEHSFMPCPKHSYDSGEYKRRTLFSFPWQPDLTLMRFIEMNFNHTEISSVKSNLEILQALYDLPLPLTPMGHLLAALCMLHSDKTVRTLAAELWNDKLRHPGGINATHIGDILGKLEAEGWAPLKRFTDLAMQSMINISARHNAALLEMVNAMDAHLNSIKINNYKKLTELQLELTRRA